MTKNGDNENTRWSRERGIKVRDRELKLKFFYEWDVGVGSERIRCCHQLPFRSRKAMAEALGLGDAQLEGSKTDNERLSQATLTRLGEYFGFDPTWDEWLNGTAWEFAKKYNEENRYGQGPTQPEPQAPAEERRTDLALEVENTEQWSYDDQLASLELKALQVGVGGCS